MNLEPCELHEISNCATCSGADKKFEVSISRSHDFEDPDDPLPVIPGATVMRARYAGNCVRCGRRYEQGAAIFQSFKSDEGWSSALCCG